MSEQRGLAPDEVIDDEVIDDEVIDDEVIDDELPAPEDEVPPDGAPPEDRQPPTDSPPLRLSREQRRIQTLRQRTRDQESEIRRLRQVQEQALTQTRQPAPQIDPYRQAEIDRQEAERVQMMAPHEVAQFYAGKMANQLQQQIARQNVEMADRMDRQGFENFAASRPAARRMASQIEAGLAEARQAGMNPTRQAIYHLLLGRQVDEQSARQTPVQRRNGQQRIASQRTQPGTPRSNAAPASRGRRGEDSDEAMVARLKSVTVGDVW